MGKGHRSPRKRVWLAQRTVRVKDPKTGRDRTAKRILVRWVEDGCVRQKTFEDPIRAGRFAAEKRDELEGLRVLATCDDVSFSEWADAYLRANYSEYDGLDQPVENGYLRQLILAAQRFIEIIGDRPLRQIRPTDIARFRSMLKGSIGPVTIESTLARMRTLMRAAWDEGLLLKKLKIEVRDLAYEKRVLEPEEIREVLEAARTWPEATPEQTRRFGDITGRLHPILATLYFTMMRRGELVHLTWNDIRKVADGEFEILVQPKEWKERDRSDKVITQRWEPKDREIRAIPVHPALVPLLEELRREKKHVLWIFTNYRGERWTESGLSSLLRRFEQAKGYEVGFQALRRSGITHLHDARVPPGQIQEIAGHASLSTTMRYVRPSAKGNRAAIRALGDG